MWRQERRCPVPLSHLGCEFTRCRRRQLSASTFGRGRKSVWFEVVCGSPSCGSGGAHSSQWECASLEGDHRAGCCCLAIQQAGALPQRPKLAARVTSISALRERIVNYGRWKQHREATGNIFHPVEHPVFACNMFEC